MGKIIIENDIFLHNEVVTFIISCNDLRYGNIFYVADCKSFNQKICTDVENLKEKMKLGPDCELQSLQETLLEMHFIYLNICYFFNLQT